MAKKVIEDMAASEQVESKVVKKPTKTVARAPRQTKQITKVEPEKENIAPTKSNSEFRVKEHLDPHSYVVVKNGFHGRLIYKSRHTGEKFIWDSFGDEQDMELQELRNVKSSSKAFFEDNLFLIEDPDVIKYLGVERYYKYSLSLSEFDELFEKTPEEVEKVVALLPKGQKRALVYKARQLIKDGKIDSIKMVTALEHSLDVELIER